MKAKAYSTDRVAISSNAMCRHDTVVGIDPDTKRKWLLNNHFITYSNSYLNQNSQAVKKECGPQNGQDEKRCEMQGGDQEMAVMVAKILITTI